MESDGELWICQILNSQDATAKTTQSHNSPETQPVLNREDATDNDKYE